MQRTLIKDLKDGIGKEVVVSGRVFNIRKLGAVFFVVLRDYSGVVQVVFKEEQDLKIGEAVTIAGVPREDKRAKGGVEFGGEKVVVRYKLYEEMPFDISKSNLNLNIETLFDNR